MAALTDRIVFDPITDREMPETELVARMIARGLGHNDDAGMMWERYLSPARIIVGEYRTSKDFVRAFRAAAGL